MLLSVCGVEKKLSQFQRIININEQKKKHTESSELNSSISMWLVIFHFILMISSNRFHLSHSFGCGAFSICFHVFAIALTDTLTYHLSRVFSPPILVVSCYFIKVRQMEWRKKWPFHLCKRIVFRPNITQDQTDQIVREWERKPTRETTRVRQQWTNRKSVKKNICQSTTETTNKNYSRSRLLPNDKWSLWRLWIENDDKTNHKFCLSSNEEKK